MFVQFTQAERMHATQHKSKTSGHNCNGVAANTREYQTVTVFI